MKKTIREVKDLKPIITQRIWCWLLSSIFAFFIDAIPFALGVSMWLWFAIYLVLVVYSYIACSVIYIMFTPATHRVSKADIDTFLINKGKDVSVGRKLKFVIVNPFTRTIKYWTKNTSNRTVKYVFYTKDNIFEEFPSKCSQNSKNTL